MKKRIFCALLASLALSAPMKAADDMAGYLFVYFTANDTGDE